MALDPLETQNIQYMNQLIQTIRNDLTGNAQRANTIKDFLARVGIYIEVNPFFTTAYEPATMAIVESIQSAMSQAMSGLPLGGNRVLFQEVARNYTMEKVTNLGNDMKTQLKEITSQGLRESKAPMSIAQEMSQKVASLGRTRAETIAQTETHRAKNLGNWYKYKEAGYEYFMVSYAGNACPYCKRAYENRVFHIDELRYLPPFHTRCRCGAKFYRNLSDLPASAVILKPGGTVPEPSKDELKDYRKQFQKPKNLQASMPDRDTLLLTDFYKQCLRITA
jgi:SPP1 gp7 family putative phage head morphogenesis protein